MDEDQMEGIDSELEAIAATAQADIDEALVIPDESLKEILEIVNSIFSGK